MLLDVGYVVDNVDPTCQGEKRVMFLAILAVVRMGISETQKRRSYNGANFSRRDLILFFWRQLRVKIICNRKCLDRITFDKNWVYVASLVVQKRATLKLSFSIPVHGDGGPSPSGSHPW